MGIGTTSIGLSISSARLSTFCSARVAGLKTQSFFRKALGARLPSWPQTITLDGNRASHSALRLLRRETIDGERYSSGRAGI